MKKLLIYDCDGMVVHRDQNFSEYFSKLRGVPVEEILPFFKGDFQKCLVGAADLKVVVEPYLTRWHWEGTREEFLQLWFESERQIDMRMIESVRLLRGKGIVCALGTNNEKYRSAYLFDVLRLREEFDACFCSAELGVKKPNPSFWLQISNKLGMTPLETQVWDDDSEHAQQARGAGFDFQLFTSREAYEKIVFSF